MNYWTYRDPEGESFLFTDGPPDGPYFEIPGMKPCGPDCEPISDEDREALHEWILATSRPPLRRRPRLWLARRLRRRLRSPIRDPRDIPGMTFWWSAQHGGPPPTREGTRVKGKRARTLPRLIAWLEKS